MHASPLLVPEHHSAMANCDPAQQLTGRTQPSAWRISMHSPLPAATASMKEVLSDLRIPSHAKPRGPRMRAMVRLCHHTRM
jgi:hypothetical protein